MYPRVYHYLLLADHALGAFFSVVLLAVVAFTFSVTGGLMKTNELRLVGGAYTHFLAELEAEARQLRSDYCMRADAAALAQARCGGELGLARAAAPRLSGEHVTAS